MLETGAKAPDFELPDQDGQMHKLSEYRGKSYFNLRIHYTTDGGSTWLPTKKGVTFAPEQLDLLSEAIEEAKKEFMSEGEE